MTKQIIVIFGKIGLLSLVKPASVLNKEAAP